MLKYSTEILQVREAEDMVYMMLYATYIQSMNLMIIHKEQPRHPPSIIKARYQPKLRFDQGVKKLPLDPTSSQSQDLLQLLKVNRK